MLMKEELARLVIEGKKRQTRRPIKAGEKLITMDGLKTVMSADGKRIKYQVGRIYSIQYGRGLPTRLFRDNDAHLLPLAEYLNWQGVKGDYNGVSADVLTVNEYIPLKIKLLDVWAEDVRQISEQDAIAEGFEHPEDTARWGFVITWTGFYDKPFNKRMKTEQWIQEHEFMARPEELYQAWALKFEVVK